MTKNSKIILEVIIVEDELPSREALKNMLNEYCENIRIVGTADTIQRGIEEINKKKPDLVFLDIEMKIGTGFDLLQKVNSLDFETIFTTAYEHYALKAIKFSAIDYLLKPIDVAELKQAIDKAKKKKDAAKVDYRLKSLINNLENPDKKRQILTLSTSEGYEFVNIEDIIYCEANGAYTNIFQKEKKRIMISKNLKEYENLLADHDFMRVHNSYLVNLGEIEKFVKSDGGFIIMKNGTRVSISPKKREIFMQRMNLI